MDTDKTNVQSPSKVQVQTCDITLDFANIQLPPPLIIPREGHEDKSLVIPVSVPPASQTIEVIKERPVSANK